MTVAEIYVQTAKSDGQRSDPDLLRYVPYRGVMTYFNKHRGPPSGDLCMCTCTASGNKPLILKLY